jgi:hypothetical protein
MSDDGGKESLPAHDGPVLIFTGCGCTYYHTIPQQIPLDAQPGPPSSETCRDKIPVARSGEETHVLVRKASVEGNCRMHDIELVQAWLLVVYREVDDDAHDEGAEEDKKNHLAMVDSEEARRYLVLDTLCSRWSLEVVDFDAPGLRNHGLRGLRIIYPHDVTEEEERRLHGLSVHEHSRAVDDMH